MAITTAQIQQLYVAYLGRAADKAGLDYWNAQLNGSTTAPATLTLEDLRANFVNEQPEYQNAYAGLTRSETVSKIYLQLFGHSADAPGLAYWTTGGGATVNTDQLLVALVNGASTTDAQIVANKVLVAEVYTSTAGANYAAADAQAALVGVNQNYSTVTTALTNLAALPGVAIPAALASLKADATAAAAQTSYETSKVDALVALNDKIVALNAGYASAPGATALDKITDTNSNGKTDYAEAAVALGNASTLRDNVSSQSTDDLATASTQATKDLGAARATLVSNDVNAVAKINAYNDAVTADAKVAAVDGTAVTNAEASLKGILDVPANQTAFTTQVAAYDKAIGTASEIETAVDLYAALVGAAGNTAKQAQLDTAFNTGAFASSYTTLKALAATDATKQASEAKVSAAEKAVGSAYVSAAEKAADAAKLLADAQSADALVTQADAETTAHAAVVKTATDAHSAVTGNTAIHDFDAATPVLDGTAKADVFYFSAIKGTDDFTITSNTFLKGDVISIGDGYTFNSNVTVGDGGVVTGTNIAAKEVYFTQATDGTVSVNIETNAIGHAAGGSADNVAVITLAGVTDLSQVSFANGLITTTHAAPAV